MDSYEHFVVQAREFSTSQDVSRAENEVEELRWLEEGSMWREDWTWLYSHASCEEEEERSFK